MPSAVCAGEEPVYAMPLRDPRLNTPAEMWVRFVFISRYILFFCALFTGIAALRDGSLLGAAKALVLFSGMVAGHAWLKAGGKLEACDRSLEAMFRGEIPPKENTGLQALLERREALERKRGTPGFDPWEVQVLRREISDYMRRHPHSTRDLGDRGGV